MKNIELENLESSVEYYYSAKRVSGEELKRIERYLERLKNMKDIGINMVKAIFFDIDGTLVSFKNHQIPKSTFDALYKLKERESSFL